MHTLRKIIVLILMLMISGCSNKSGEYGPFTLVIESEDGQKVDDILVTLALVSSGGHGKYSTYKETQVVSSGEPIIFPRGYVSGTKGVGFGMNISIDHLDYQKTSPDMVDVYTTQQQQTIDLGKATIKFKVISDKEIARIVKQGNLIKNKGRITREAITKNEAIISIKRSDLYYISNNYFVRAMRIGREDLIEKYMALKLLDIYGKDIGMAEAKAFEKELRDNIEYYRSYGK